MILLPGAGGRPPDLSIFTQEHEDTTHFQVVGYPGWRTYVANDFSAKVLVEHLVKDIISRVPCGPIRIVGLSIGGHFGYSAALRLRALGRDVAGFCAIDSFMPASAAASVGWKGRALAEGLELLFRHPFRSLGRFFRSRFWRALIRLADSQLIQLLRPLASSKRLSSFLFFDPIFEQELNMRLLIRESISFIRSLDCDPVASLEAPAVLLRTDLTSGDDAAWRRRCSNLKIFTIPGQHHNLFEPENAAAISQAFISATRDWREEIV